MIYISYVNNSLKLFSTTIQVDLLTHTLKYVHYLEEIQNLASVVWKLQKVISDYSCQYNINILLQNSSYKII